MADVETEETRMLTTRNSEQGEQREFVRLEESLFVCEEPTQTDYHIPYIVHWGYKTQKQTRQTLRQWITTTIRSTWLQAQTMSRETSWIAGVPRDFFDDCAEGLWELRQKKTWVFPKIGLVVCLEMFSDLPWVVREKCVVCELVIESVEHYTGLSTLMSEYGLEALLSAKVLDKEKLLQLVKYSVPRWCIFIARLQKAHVESQG